MIASRRTFIKGSATTLAATSAMGYKSFATAQTARPKPFPDSQDLQPGDFLWPKKPEAFVPYNAGRDASYEEERVDWERGKAQFIQSVRKDPKATLEMREFANRLEALEFREFLGQYQNAEKPGVPDTYGGGFPAYVGHVGIVYFDGGLPSVVEALWGKGVVVSKYEDWLRGRSGELVWHGRVRDIPMANREGIADEALSLQGKPYNFWLFNLSDESGFYCSKLAWLSVMRALKFPVDGNAEPKRSSWFSPKQLMMCNSVYLLNNPGSYTFPNTLRG